MSLVVIGAAPWLLVAVRETLGSIWGRLDSWIVGSVCDWLMLCWLLLIEWNCRFNAVIAGTEEKEERKICVSCGWIDWVNGGSEAVKGTEDKKMGWLLIGDYGYCETERRRGLDI
jgi:hypothetical protein